MFPKAPSPRTGLRPASRIATAICSALAKIPVRCDVAMTGEITLRGRVLPIGGLKEKLLAAHRHGIAEAIVPRDNEKDLPDIPENVRKDMKLHFVDSMDEVLKIALEREIEALPLPAPRRWKIAAQPAKRNCTNRTSSRRPLCGAADDRAARVSKRICRTRGAMDAQYIIGAAHWKQFPPEELPEVAFLGRSNVGKSSLLNCLLGGRRLARTSGKPGCTRLVHFYRVDGRLCFVDLPGYGYAKVPQPMIASWKELMEAYLLDGRTWHSPSCWWMPAAVGWKRIWNSKVGWSSTTGGIWLSPRR